MRHAACWVTYFAFVFHSLSSLFPKGNNIQHNYGYLVYRYLTCGGAEVIIHIMIFSESIQ